MVCTPFLLQVCYKVCYINQKPPKNKRSQVVFFWRRVRDLNAILNDTTRYRVCYIVIFAYYAVTPYLPENGPFTPCNKQKCVIKCVTLCAPEAPQREH